MADLVARVGYDDSAVSRGLAATDQKFNALGTKIEQSTAGARKFTGALSSTLGAVTGTLGVIGLISGAVAGVVGLTGRWHERQEAVSRAAAATRDRLADIRKETADLGRTQAFLESEERATRRRLSELGSPTITGRHGSDERRRQLREIAEERAALQDRLRRIEELREAQEAFDRQKREGEILRELQRQTEERHRQAEAERRLAEAEEERLRRAAEESQRLAQSLREQVEAANLRARGLEEQADALERQADLARLIKQIEESGAFSDSERRELIEKAKETARLQAEAARAQRAAGVTGEGVAARGAAGAVSLAAGFAGDAVLTRQALGAGGTAAEQQQLATQQSIARFVKQIAETFDRLRNQPRVIF